MRTTLFALVGSAALAGAGCGSRGAGPVPRPTPDPAAEVLRVDARLNQIEFPDGRDAARLRGALAEVNGIDISRCPPDYQDAYVQFASALGAQADYLIETGSWVNLAERGAEAFVRGFLGDPFGVAREDRERRRQLQTRITEVTANYQRTVAKYRGVSDRGDASPAAPPQAGRDGVDARLDEFERHLDAIDLAFRGVDSAPPAEAARRSVVADQHITAMGRIAHWLKTEPTTARQDERFARLMARADAHMQKNLALSRRLRSRP